MSHILSWLERDYESGLDRGVLYPQNSPGVVWDGLISIAENDPDEVISSRYVDGVKTHRQRLPGSFAGTLEAYTYPDALFEDILTQRQLPTFGLSYRIQTATGYKVHLVYNLKIPRGEISHNQTEAGSFKWDFTTLPVLVPGARSSAHLVVDTSLAYSWTVDALYDILYGTDAVGASLPSPATVLDLFEVNSILQIIDNGDGTWTAIGPDSVIEMLDSTTFQIDWPSAIYIDAETYTIHSL